MKRLRIAVAGVGAIGRRHIELVLADRNCGLAAIVDPASSAGEVAAKAGVLLFSSLADLFKCERPDGVILATPNNLHLEPGLAHRCGCAGLDREANCRFN